MLPRCQLSYRLSKKNKEVQSANERNILFGYVFLTYKQQDEINSTITEDYTKNKKI